MSKGCRKYNWEKLKAEFLAGDWLTLTSFLKAKKIPMGSAAGHADGWVAEKKRIQKDALMATTQQMIQEDFRDILKVRLRQARLSRFLQLKGMQALKDKEPETIEDARKLIVSGLQEERRALGLESNIAKQNLTQINIRTNLDKQLAKLSYEELIKLLAELKRLGAGSTVSKGPNTGTGKIEEGEII